MPKKLKLHGSMKTFKTSRLTPKKKDVLFLIGDWNAKVGSQNTPGETGKFWPWNTKWIKAKANRVLPKECMGHNKHPLPATQELILHVGISRWPIPKSDYVLCSQKWRSSIQSAKTRLGADCSSDHELLIAKFRLKMNKIMKTTRPFRYDLNQIRYDCTVEVRNRFKRLSDR